MSVAKIQSAAAELTADSSTDQATSSFEANHNASPQPNPSSTTHVVPLLDLTAAGANRRHLPTPPASPRPNNPLSPRQRRQTSKNDLIPPSSTVNGVTDQLDGEEESRRSHRRSNSAEVIGQETTHSSEEDEPFNGLSLSLSREGLGRRSMSEKRHAMEAAQQYSFYQEWSSKKQQNGHEGQQEESSDRQPLASSQQLLQRCQRLLAQRHPSTDSLSASPLRASLPAVSQKRPGHRPVPPPVPKKEGEEVNMSTSLRNGPLKAVEPLQVENESTFSMDSASLLSTASTTALHNRRRTRPISFRRAVDPSLREPDDEPNTDSITLRPSRGRNRQDCEAKTSSGFWKSLWQRKKSRNPQQRTAPLSADTEERVLAWQRRNDLEGNWGRFQSAEGEVLR